MPKFGQSSIEYLIVLAIGLILAIVTLSLLGFFPDIALNLEYRNAEAFWQGEARPFTIPDSVYTEATKRAYIAFENMDMEDYNISSISLNGSQIGFYEYNTSWNDNQGPSYLVTPGCSPPYCVYSFVVGARQTKSITTDNFMSADEICGVGGTIGTLPFDITYQRVSNSAVFTEKSTYPLSIKCIRD